MATLIEKLKRLVRLASKSESRSEVKAQDETRALRRVFNEDVIQQLMHMLENTHDREYTCEEAFAVLDEYVDLVVDEEDAAVLMPLVKRHIDMCVDCRDEYETLMRVLQGDSAESKA